MTYLEKKIKTFLDVQGYVLIGADLSDVERQIENENECQREIYEVAEWFKDTKANFPENLLNIDDTLKALTKYLSEQTYQCYEQTGFYPQVEDYIGALQADDCPVKVPLELLIRIMVEKIGANI